MNPSFDLPDPDRFTAGTLGPPGQRVFYLQAHEGGLILTLRCEKQQVAAMADYFDGLMEDLEPAPAAVAEGDLRLDEPVQELWTVGAIGVAYDEPRDRVVVVLEEMLPFDPDAEDDDEDDALEPEGASVRVHLTRAQVGAFVRHARGLVAKGRASCRFCGLPLDPTGHACPRMN